MLKRVLRCTAAVFAASFSLLAHAQFQKPTPEELQMTSDPKAPGAAAVYLNIDETADDNLHYKTFYARIKVLTEKGKSLANVEIPYAGEFKVKYIQARTIHPDGTILPLDVKPEDLLSAKSGNQQFGKIVFTLPSVEVGSILEYSYDLIYPDAWVSSPRWDLQRDYFVHKAHYSFTPFKAFLQGAQNSTSRYVFDSTTGQILDNLIWWASLPPGTPPLKSDAVGRFSVDLTDIPARPDEEWMPPLESLLYKVQFYYKGSYSSGQFWLDEGKRWSKEVDHFADPSSTLREAVAGITAPADADLVKAEKIYDAVQALDNTDYSREKSDSEKKQLKIKSAKRAEDVWKQKSGDSEDMALLYLAMLRAAGLKAYALKVVDRGRTLFDPTYLDRDQFDATMVLLQAGTQQILLDPGEKLCPFKTVSWGHSDTVGLGQSDSGPVFSKTPPQNYNNNATARSADIDIDEHGRVTGTLNILMNGQAALRWRQMALENDPSEVKKNFDNELAQLVPPGIDAHVDHFIGLNDSKTALMAVGNLHGAMGAATSKRLLLPGFFFESRGQEPFVAEEKRLTPVDMQFPERMTDQVIYHLPANLSVEGAIQDANIPWPQHAVYIVKSKTELGQITITRALLRGFDIVAPSEYQDLRGFYQKVAAGDQQQLVLHAAPQVNGN
jgi:Domain of Unknown Function with PDB structure (DUF3857)/Transglutaminase-like superfamily